MVSIVQYTGHKVLRLAAGAFIDKIKIGDNWDSANLGLFCRYSREPVPSSNTYFGEVKLFVGFCNGFNTGQNDYPLSTVNFVGLKLIGNSLFQTGAGYSSLHNFKPYGTKMQGSSETAVGPIEYQTGFGEAHINLEFSTKLSIYGVQINRSAATIRFFGHNGSGGAGSAQCYAYSPTDIGKFKLNTMESITENIGWSLTYSLAMPSGPLDHICIYNGRADLNFDIHGIHFHKKS